MAMIASQNKRKPDTRSEEVEDANGGDGDHHSAKENVYPKEQNSQVSCVATIRFVSQQVRSSLNCGFE